MWYLGKKPESEPVVKCRFRRDEERLGTKPQLDFRYPNSYASLYTNSSSSEKAASVLRSCRGSEGEGGGAFTSQLLPQGLCLGKRCPGSSSSPGGKESCSQNWVLSIRASGSGWELSLKNYWLKYRIILGADTTIVSLMRYGESLRSDTNFWVLPWAQFYQNAMTVPYFFGLIS